MCAEAKHDKLNRRPAKHAIDKLFDYLHNIYILGSFF